MIYTDTKKIKRWVVILGIINFLLVAGTLISVILFWKPWDQTISANARKLTITGTATVKAEPDQFRFSPSYTKDTTAEISKLNEQIIATLKNLGVKKEQIKNNASKYGSPDIYYMDSSQGKERATLSLTITVEGKELAQKVQNYLLTTSPSGAISPNGVFSATKQKQLENQARGDAIKDAKNKASQTASGLGAKIGKVIEVSEGSSNGGGMCNLSGIACPMASDGSTISKDSAPDNSLTLQPGTNELTYSFTVVFALE